MEIWVHFSSNARAENNNKNFLAFLFTKGLNTDNIWVLLFPV